MVNISRGRLSPDLLDKLFSILFEVLGRKRTHEDFLFAINTFLSSKERILIAKRVTIMYLLLQEIEQSTIARVLHVSTATVNKYALHSEKDANAKKLFSKLLMEQKILTVFETLMDALFPPGTYGTNWKAGWERRKELQRRKATGL